MTARAERIEEAARALLAEERRMFLPDSRHLFHREFAALRAALDLAPPAPGAVVADAWAVVGKDGKVADVWRTREAAERDAEAMNKVTILDAAPYRVVPLVRGEA